MLQIDEHLFFKSGLKFCRGNSLAMKANVSVLSLCHCSDAVPCGSLLAAKRFIIGLTGDRELQEEPHREEEDNDDDDAAFFFFFFAKKQK